jgi:hypothetical protein
MKGVAGATFVSNEATGYAMNDTRTKPVLAAVWVAAITPNE